MSSPEPAPAPAPPPKQKMKVWKKVLFIGGGVVLGLVVLILAIGPAIIASVAKSRIASTLREKLQADVAIGNVSFSWSGHVRIDDFRLVPKNFTEPLVEVKKVDVTVSLASAIGGSYLADVEVVGPKILVEKGADGKFNYEFPPSPPKPEKPKSEKESKAKPFVQANVKVRDGGVRIRGRGRETVFPLSMTAKVDTLEKPVAYDVALGEIKAKGAIDLESISGPSTVTFDKLSLRSLGGAARAYSSVDELDGTIDGTLDYVLQGVPKMSGKGTLELRDVVVDRVKVGRITVTHDAGERHAVRLSSGKALNVKVVADLQGDRVKAEVNGDSDLGELGRMLESMFKPDVSLEGSATVTGTIEAQGATSAKGELRLVAANVIAIDAKEKKRFEIEKSLQLELAGAWDGTRKTATAEVLKLTSSFATLDGKGGAVIAGETPEIRETKITLDADLEKLAVKLKSFLEKPPALGGKATVHAIASGEKLAVGVDLKGLKFEKVGPFDAALRHDGTLDKTGSGRHTIRLDSGKAVSMTATADVKDGYKETRATKVDLKVDSDLGALAAMLPGLVQLKPGVALEGKASATGRAETKGSTWAKFDVAANFDNLEAVEPFDPAQGKKGKRQEVDKAIRLQAAGLWDGQKKSVAIDACTLTSSFATADAKGGVSLGTPISVKESSLLLQADLEKLGSRLALFMADAPGLKGAVRATGSFAGEKGNLEGSIQGLQVTTKRGALSLPDAAITAAATVHAQVEVSAVVKAPAFQWVDPGYSAKGSLEAQLVHTDKGTTGTTKLGNLEVVDEKKNVIKDPGLTIVHDIGFADEFRTIDLRRVDVAASFLKGGITGKIVRRDPGMEFQKVRCAFKYIPEKLSAIAQPWLPGRLEGAEEKTLDVTLDGKAASADALAVLRGTAGTIDLDLARFTMDGLSLSGKTAFRLQDGKLTSGTPLNVNQGRSDLNASLDFNPKERNPQSTFTFNAKDVEANGQMGPILERLNPIFHTSGIDAKVDGRIQSDFRLAWAGAIDPDEKNWTAAASKALSGGGTFGAQNLHIVGSPVVAKIMEALGQGNALQGELIATQIRIEDGRCSYQNMILRGGRKDAPVLQRDQEQLAADRRELEEDKPQLHPKEYASRLAELKQREEELPFRYTLKFTGWVKFDKTMQLRVLMPMTQNMIKAHPNLKKYIGTSFWVDLNGSTDKPSLDFNKMLGEAAKRAAEGILAEKATDLLAGLLKNKKREAEAEKLFGEAQRAETDRNIAHAVDLYKKVLNDYRDTEFVRKKKKAIEDRLSQLQGK